MRNAIQARSTSEVLQELLVTIDEREQTARARLDALAGERVAVPRSDGAGIRRALRAESIAVRGELVRLQLLASLARGLLGP